MEPSSPQFQPQDGVGTMIEILTQARRRLEIHRAQITSAIENITRVVEGCGSRDVGHGNDEPSACPTLLEKASEDVAVPERDPADMADKGSSHPPSAPATPPTVRKSGRTSVPAAVGVIASAPVVPAAPDGTASSVHSAGDLYRLVVRTMMEAGCPLLASEIKRRLAEVGHVVPTARIFALCQKRVESSKMTKSERGFSLVPTKA